ncbi:MAG: hypothetical protein PHF33_01830 [Candidatus Delongbacteria bacterium]|jgi:hypothetical protein|nr:hypothetical protein [Candidatus Delongbacteria bacterium]MDD4204852.1 hypothetical protein [Candidatus Delongbacteria bacterium]MDY0016851.1 hypothetical protein [Candidatus Delongbacteria bacterium]
MKKEIPILIGFFATIGWYLEFFFAGTFFENWKMFFTTGFRSVAIVSLIVGIVSVLRVNYSKIKYNNDRWFSVYQMCIIALMIIFASLRGVSPGTPFDAMFTFGFIPLDATVFSLLAFYVASAAYRSFKIKSIESAFLLVAAILIMLSKMPLGEAMWSKIPTIGEWIMDAPTSAGKRAILFGAFLGGLTMMIRIAFGLEKSHLSD